ncbi:MAG: DMT family transporter [Pseudomonadota bacterium]
MTGRSIAQSDMTSRAWIELTLLAVIWGASFFSIAIALQEMGPVTAVLHRVFWAALVLWVVVSWLGLAVPKDPRIWGAFLIMGLLNNVIPFTLMSWGQTQIETGLVSIFNATTALFGVLIAAMVFRDERLNLRKLTGIGLGVFGVAVISGVSDLFSLDLRSLGQLAVLAGALSYGLASSWAKLTLKGHHPVVAAAGMLTGSSIVMIPVTFALEGVPSLNLSFEVWTAITYYALLATAGAYLLYYRVLAMAGAGNLMLCTLMIPPIAILLGWMFLGEQLEMESLLGFLLISLGLVVIDGRILRTIRPTTTAP